MANAAIRPWFVRLVESVPLPPIGALLAVAGVALAVETGAFAVGHWIAQSPIRLGPMDVFDALVHPALCAYGIWAGWLVWRGSVAELRALEGIVARPASEYEALVHRATWHPPRRMALAALAGAAVPFVVARLYDGTFAAYHFDDGWLLGVRMLLWMILVPTFLVSIVATLAFWRCGRDFVRVELLDLDALAPFARFGLRLALLPLGALALLAPGLALGPSGVTVALIFALSGPFVLGGLAALLIPCAGLHGRIRAAKAEELARVRAAIRGEREALRDSPLAAESAALSIVDLLAYRERIEGLREWPFDARALRRFGLYLLIPLASWIGAALVERLVDSFVG